MHLNPYRSSDQHRWLAMLLMAATLPFVICSVTCGQENQDRSKRKQVEGPLLNVLQQNQADTNTALEIEANLDPARRTASLIATADGKQPAEASPVPSAPNGAFAKALIEMPPKLLLGSKPTQADPAAEALKLIAQLGRMSEPSADSTAKRDNPSVQPGRVNWHADLATATKQSKTSGKPVFHFQLLGQLDQRFT